MTTTQQKQQMTNKQKKQTETDYVTSKYMYSSNSRQWKIIPKTLKYWVGGVQCSGVSLTLWGEVVSLALAGQPSSDGITIKNTFGVDVYYIDQSHTLSFLIGLVETKSDFIVSSVETGLGRWALVVAVISVDAYPFLAFSDLTCHLEDTGIGVFWLHCATW